MPDIRIVALALALSAMSGAAAAAEHKCDPVTDEGWSVVAERETLSEAYSAPYRAGSDWFVTRITTVLPFCHYFNSIGIYSMRSYSLEPVTSEEKIAICRQGQTGGSAPVAPYAGPCPPRQGASGAR
jgi:hypothetical protein